MVVVEAAEVARDDGWRFEIPEKFHPVAGPEYSRNRNFERNFDFVPVISGVF
jgi:hypothetical protein